ncbi:hypothetical protein Tco_0535115 [Tanacetum coccineum]
MTHDSPEGVVRFTNGTDEVAYKMPHMIEQYNSLSDLEKEYTKLVYLRKEEDKRRGVKLYLMKKAFIIEQRVKIDQKAHILELKQRNHEEHCSNNIYAVSIKEDMAYMCLTIHSATTKKRSICRIQMKPYTVLDCESWNILEYNNCGPHAEKP